MERVQFQQEQMLIELKDLVQKGLFNQKEVKRIMQKRTMFETALVRRIPKKSDFLRYATYEMSLEALRRKRAEQLEKGPPSVSDYALVRRQFQIFERALRKFKGDVGLWIQYIKVAKKEGARSLVGRITARALQLHPNVPALYVFAASHELEHLSPTAARALLQRGLRLNADSVEMWREYVRMEMGFVESLRRRWGILGIETDGKHRDTNGRTRTDEVIAGETHEMLGDLRDEEDSEPTMEVDAREESEEDEAARKQIMDGAIVKSTISSAVKALPNYELFASLHELISGYPSTNDLREALLDDLHAHLRRILPSHPLAIKLIATRHLTTKLIGEPLIDALKGANDELLVAVRGAVNETKQGVAKVYAEFAEEWCGRVGDDSLKAYLITSIHLLIHQLPAPVPPELLAAHVRLLASYQASLKSGQLPPKANTPEKILHVARRHTNKAPSSAAVWLARLDAERRFAEPDAVQTAWTQARTNVKGDGIQDVWLWGLRPQDRPSHTNADASSPALAESEADVQLLERLLQESQLIQASAEADALREALLLRYAAASHHALLYSVQVAHDASAIGSTRSDSGPSLGQRGAGRASGPVQQQLQRNHNSKLRQHTIGSVRGSGSRAIPAADPSIIDARLARIRRIGAGYVPTTRVWREVFEQQETRPTSTDGENDNHSDGTSNAVARSVRGGLGVPRAGGVYYDGGEGDLRVLRSVYEFWRQTDGVEATTAWCTWLLRHGQAREAVGIVGRVRSVLGETDGEMVERRWKAVLDGDAGLDEVDEGEDGGEYVEAAAPETDSE